MTLTLFQHPNMQKTFFKSLLLTGLLLLCGCTNNPTLLKLFYGQMDNALKREIISYADFSTEQKNTIRAAVDETVEWHRREALTGYVQDISEAQRRLLDTSVESQDIDWLIETFTRVGQEFEAQSPFLKLLPLIKSINDQQAEQVRDKINKEFEEQQKEQKKAAKQGEAKVDTKDLAKFFKRLGLKLSKSQKQKIEQTFSMRQITLTMRMQAWRSWGDELIKNIEERDSSDFEQRFKALYLGRSDLIKTTYPEAWQHDNQLARDMLLDLFQNLSEDQKNKMRKQLNVLTGVASDLAQS